MSLLLLLIFHVPGVKVPFQHNEPCCSIHQHGSTRGSIQSSWPPNVGRAPHGFSVLEPPWARIALGSPSPHPDPLRPHHEPFPPLTRGCSSENHMCSFTRAPRGRCSGTKLALDELLLTSLIFCTHPDIPRAKSPGEQRSEADVQ